MTDTSHQGKKGGHHQDREFAPLGIKILVVSDTRDLRSDTSGAWLEERCQQEGHQVLERMVVRDEAEEVRAQVADWCQDQGVNAVLVTGGTGLFARDITPEAVEPLFDKFIPGFGELFRMLSYEEIGTATIESRATAGIVARTVVFVMPGSRGACRLALEDLILPQLDSRTKPCSIAGMIDRL